MSEKARQLITRRFRRWDAGGFKAAALVVGSLALLLSFAPPALGAAQKQIVNTLGAAAPGESGGLFNTPRDIAVNQAGAGGVAAGTFYVVDNGNRRIQRFGPTGEFVSAWGWGVEQGNPEFGVCTEAANCQKGIGGAGPGQLGANGPQGIAVDQNTGHVYVSDQAGANRRISIFGPKGQFEGAFGWGAKGAFDTELQFCTTATGCGTAQQQPAEGTPAGACGMLGNSLGGLFVDAAGSLYLANKFFRRVDVFQPVFSSGKVVGIECLRVFGWDVVLEGPDETVSDQFEVCNVALNPTDVCKTGTAGAGLGQFATSSPVDVVTDSLGNLFAVDNNTTKRVQEFTSSSQPITATFGSVPLSAVFGTGELLNVAVDPFNDHVLVSGKRSASASQLAVVEMNHAGAEPVTHGPELPANSSATSTGLGGLAAASSALGGNVYVSIGTAGILHGVEILNGEPTVTEVADVTGTTALFKGKVVSNEINVTYHFEYSTDGKTWTKVPLTDANAATQPGEIQVEQEATGLTGSQTYSVRLVQDRKAGGGVAISEAVEFTTGPAAPGILGIVASPIRDTRATFNGYLDPQNDTTEYWFEYGLSDCSAEPTPCVALPHLSASGGGIRLAAESVGALQPKTIYHYRLVASNAIGKTASPDAAFETFESQRILPDGRAYELVTPGEPGALAFNGLGFGENEGHGCFDVWPATENGESVVSLGAGGAPPGLPANGNWDLYESRRGPTGWTTISKSPSGAASAHPSGAGALCPSSDHLYSTFTTGKPPGDEGALVIEGKQTSYVREPDGSFTLVGQGTGGTAPETDVRFIADGADHLFFTAKVQLESGAAPTGTEAIYDRSPGGPTKVVSLLPGDIPLAAGQPAEYLGASRDGSTVAFRVDGKIYARVDGIQTRQVAVAPNTFAGISDDGQKVFYSAVAPIEASAPNPGDLFVFNTEDLTTEEVAEESDFVNVSSDGTSVFFLSQLALDGSAVAGENNLYRWDEAGGVGYIATVSPSDVIGDTSLARWTNAAVSPDTSSLKGPANDPSRSTPDGSAFVFESRANIAGYDSGGHREIYRYAVGEEVACVSCPIVPAAGDAALMAPFGTTRTSPLVRIQNVTDNGKTVVFQTEDPLVPQDVNGTWDVYEWKVGQQAYPISSGQSQNPNLLYGMTSSGSDLFFLSTERFVSGDLSNVSSIYDARTGGGFPEAPAGTPPCEGDACQGMPQSAPVLPASGSSVFIGPSNPKPHRHKARKHRKHRKRATRRHRKHRQKAHRASGDRRATR